MFRLYCAADEVMLAGICKGIADSKVLMCQCLAWCGCFLWFACRRCGILFYFICL